MTTFAKITMGLAALCATALPAAAQAQVYGGQLQCTPAYQTVAVGQVANFRAQGGAGTYNWSTAERSFLNIGPALNTGFTAVGAQTATVTSGNESASCSVNVVPAGSAPMPGYLPGGQGNPGGYTQGTQGTQGSYYCPPSASYPCQQPPQPPVLTQQYYPYLPNTGVMPETGAQVALMVLLLGAAGALAYPYARKAFIVALS